MTMFTDPVEHLRAELARLDVLLHRQILRLRAAYQLSLDEFRGLYISDQHVDNLIDRAAGERTDVQTIAELTARAEAMRRDNVRKLSADLPWTRLIAEFGLSDFEQEALLLAMAPEIDLKYDTLYAYLNNDVMRKWPTRDLALRLFSNKPSDVVFHRSCLLDSAPLFREALLKPLQMTAERPSWLSKGFSISPVVSQYLFGLPALDSGLSHCVREMDSSEGWGDLPFPTSLLEKLRRLPDLLMKSSRYEPMPFIIFEGRHGSGRASAAAAVCRGLNMPLLLVNVQESIASSEPQRKVFQALVLHRRLRMAGICLEGCEILFDKEWNPLPEGYIILGELARSKGPIFFICAKDTPWQRLLKGRRCLDFQFGDLDFNGRLRVWEGTVQKEGIGISQHEMETLADRFVFTPGQIRETVKSAVDSGLLKGEQVEDLCGESLSDAARAQSQQSFGNLALKVKTIHTWKDLVLPAVTLRQIREVAAATKCRHVVYTNWGFGKRIALGKGLKILFSGASGTGKTMTAGVIARDLGLDMYKIDLSGIVSKYIGETEKNLDRIFRAAHAGNAILFFDEADALFGKRSEVKDAHDRYANVEVSYLLMKMEEHEGLVILASNLSGNIDEAFSRRMHYVVEFPLPDETYREELWRAMFPPEAPVGENVDFAFLAKQFELSGGDIRNIALDAAFLAAQNGQVVTMKELVKALSRQMLKERKVVSATDFLQYYELIERS